VLYGHGDLSPVTTIVLLASLLLAETPTCRRASQTLFDHPPLVLECRVEGGDLVYSVQVKPESDRALTGLILNFRGAIRSVSTPTDWHVRQERKSEELGTEISWSASEAKWRKGRSKASITFRVVVSGSNAGFSCGESRLYARKDGGMEGGENGCPIG